MTSSQRSALWLSAAVRFCRGKSRSRRRVALSPYRWVGARIACHSPPSSEARGLPTRSSPLETKTPFSEDSASFSIRNKREGLQLPQELPESRTLPNLQVLPLLRSLGPNAGANCVAFFYFTVYSSSMGCSTSSFVDCYSVTAVLFMHRWAYVKYTEHFCKPEKIALGCIME